MTNLAFTALIKSKGYNKQRLADACGLSQTQMSNRINGANDWRWPEVGKVCAALGITLDEFATYYPVADVRKSTATPAPLIALLMVEMASKPLLTVTTSTPSSPQGRLLGSRSERTFTA